MPAIYAHDKFGKEVYKTLTKEDRKIIRTYLPQFRIGLQGPDFLFFYNPLKKNPISTLGHNIHENHASKLLTPMMDVIRMVGKNSPEYAYVLGLICHFTLDSESHHCVNRYVALGESGLLDFQLGHIELEMEFERFMMERDGLNPLSSNVWKLIPVDDVTAKTLANLYPEIDAKTARSCLFQMHHIKKILTAPNPIKYKIIDAILHIGGHYDSMQGHLMKHTQPAKCSVFLELMNGYFNEAIPVATKLIEEWKKCVELGTELPTRFQTDFIANPSHYYE